jgi:two-component system, response regulator PdtaR
MVLTPPEHRHDEPFSILIADDDAGNRKTLRQLLEERGFRTHVAADGGEAVEIVQVQTVHLVLIDMHMPRLTGLEAVQLIQQVHALLPAILMTADATRELIRQAHQAQVYSVIPKPVNPNIVLHTLTRALAQFYKDIKAGPATKPVPPQPGETADADRAAQ